MRQTQEYLGDDNIHQLHLVAQETKEGHLEDQGKKAKKALGEKRIIDSKIHVKLFVQIKACTTDSKNSQPYFCSRSSAAASNDSVRWNTEGQEGLPEGWTLQVMNLT